MGWVTIACLVVLLGTTEPKNGPWLAMVAVTALVLVAQVVHVTRSRRLPGPGHRAG